MRIRAAFGPRLAAAALAFVSCAALGQPKYPSKPVRLIAPFAPGGLVDVLSRAVADKLKPAVGQPVIVDNRPGAGGNIGASLVARAEPDGYTLLMSSAGILTINQFLYAKMPFEPSGAFSPVTLVADMPMLMVLNPGFPARSVAEFLAYAKKPDAQVNFGSPGNGTTGHLGMEMLQAAARIRLTHVPYKSAAEAIAAVIGGQIQGAMDNPPTVLEHIRGGRLKAIAVAARARLPQLPDVPTFNEAGLKGFEASSWFGLVAPAKTPRAIIVRLNREIGLVLRDPEMVQRFAALGARLSPGTAEEFADHIEAERAKWETIVKRANIKLQDK
jgi:tripartite-type tricarboxylate transporter receptor subunit TctC